MPDLFKNCTKPDEVVEIILRKVCINKQIFLDFKDDYSHSYEIKERITNLYVNNDYVKRGHSKIWFTTTSEGIYTLDYIKKYLKLVK